MSSHLQPVAPLKILTVLGTRPEAVKLAPVIREMRRRPGRFSVHVCLTGQHRELVEDVLPVFGIAADENLRVMTAGQTLCGSTAKILDGLQPVLAQYAPDVVMVQGDTTTTFCGALAGFYSRIAVAHVEAGLRTGDVQSPFPEEANRQMVTRLASYHFAATADAANNLYREGIPEQRVWVTGNTGIDAVRGICGALEQGAICPALPLTLHPKRKLILVTAHRRENIPFGLEQIAHAASQLARRLDVQVVFLIHPNPSVRAVVERVLGGEERVHLVEALRYAPFIELMRRAYLILSDSGGIQEEAPALGKPVLVLRETTERAEAVTAGATQLVGTDCSRIVTEATTLLDDAAAYVRRAQVRDVYGDGRASVRICSTLWRVLGRQRLGIIRATPRLVAV